MESYQGYNPSVLVVKRRPDQMVAVTTSDFIVKRNLNRAEALWIMAPDMQLCCSRQCMEMYLTVGFLP